MDLRMCLSSLEVAWTLKYSVNNRSAPPQLQPLWHPWLLDHFQFLARNGDLCLLTIRMANPDKEFCQQKGDAQHRAARVGGQSARSIRIKQTKQTGKYRQGPHGWIRR